MRWESILLLAASLLSLLFTLSRARSPGSSKQLKLAKHSLLLAALLAAWNFSVAFFISLESYGKLNLVHIIGYNLILSLVLIVAIMPVRKAKKHVSSLYIKTVAVVFMIISISNLILPSFEVYSFIWVGPLAGFALPLSLSHGNLDGPSVFDGKKYMFKAMTYTISIAVLVGLYTTALYLFILPIIQPGASLEMETILLIVFGTMATILLYDKIKNIFDSITDKYFFKKGYTLTELLEELDQEMIDCDEVEEIADSLKRMVQKYFKSEFMVLETMHGNFKSSIDSREQKVRSGLREGLAKELRLYHMAKGSRVALADNLDRVKFKQLYSELQNESVSVAIDLGEKSNRDHHKDYRFLLLGGKKSGERYTKLELRSLSIIAKELVITLQGAMRFEEIKHLNSDLERRISASTKQLRKQNSELIKADEFKDDFLSIASHQMRTPISAINGYTSILKDGDAGDLNSKQAQFINIIEENTNKLSDLINDFLTASRLNSGKFEINKNKVDFEKILKEELQGVRLQTNAKKIKLTYHIDQNIKDVNVDGPRLRQVVVNMLDNAIRYTPKGGRIYVELFTERGRLNFKVKDSGIGIPKSEQPRLFSKMFRATNAKSIRPDGTGLGLYLARKIVLGHGGHVIFTTDQGHGSVFGFEVPTQ
jgi:signal transduction histidine kinase